MFYQCCNVFWIEKTTYLCTYWECKVSPEFARLSIGVAFPTTIFRNSSFSGMSPKKVSITQSVLIVLKIEDPPGKIP